MLVLTLQLGEQIDITLPDGSKGVIELVYIRNKHAAKIGFALPKSVTVDRRAVTEDKAKNGVRK